MMKASRMKLIIFYLLVVLYAFQISFSDTSEEERAVVLPVSGSVYTLGYYYVHVNIGIPPNLYYLEIDTRSDLTWIQCDAPCNICFLAPHDLYKPTHPFEACNDPLCAAVTIPETTHCKKPTDRCDYETVYESHQATMGYLIKDYFPLIYNNGTLTKAPLAFGCGYAQELAKGDDPGNRHYFDGVLGLGNGQVSFMNQLKGLGVTKTAVVGHCFSSSQDGYLYFGDASGPITWTPYTYTEKNYSVGTAEIFLGEKTIGVTSLPFVFDSGATYAYLDSEAYGSLVSLLSDDLKKQQISINIKDHTLPICWKGDTPFNTTGHLRQFFRPIVLRFGNSRTLFQLDPEAYLITSLHGNACLGIFNGTEAGIGNFNLLGALAFYDKLIIYDNEKKQIGWAPSNCNVGKSLKPLIISD